MFKKRTFRRGFRKKPLVKWHSSLLTYSPPTNQAIVVNTPNAVELLNTGERGATQALSVLADNQVECRVNAIRGTLIFENDSSTLFHQISWGILVGDLNNNVFPATFANPTILADSTKPWLWLEHMLLAPAVATRAGLSVRHYDVNIRSKRVLKPGQTLYLVYYDTNIGGTPTNDCSIYMALRTLITRLD